MRRLQPLLLSFALACGGPSPRSTPVDGRAGIDAPSVADAGCGALTQVPSPPSDPPWSGTAFIAPELLTDADPTAFIDLTYAGQSPRQMYDRRSESFITVDAHLFPARFGATTTVEIQVNPEFDRATAEVEARRYATVIGRLPAFVFVDLETVWIHRGHFPFGGGNRNLLIHTEQGAQYAAGGYLEEIFLHEGTHTSLDVAHATAGGWRAAIAADGVAISTYARDNPDREDLAESVVPYLAARHGGGRVAAATVATIEATIPNRLRYLDCLALPLTAPP